MLKRRYWVCVTRSIRGCVDGVLGVFVNGVCYRVTVACLSAASHASHRERGGTLEAGVYLFHEALSTRYSLSSSYVRPARCEGGVGERMFKCVSEREE